MPGRTVEEAGWWSMSTVGTDVRERLADADEVLAGLALAGTPQHDLITGAPNDGTAGIVRALQAVTHQARISQQAALRAGADAGWLRRSAADWQQYLRWLVRHQHGLTLHLDAVAEADRHEIAMVWAVTTRECEAARRQWGTIAGELDGAGPVGSTVKPRPAAVPGPPEPSADILLGRAGSAGRRNELETVVLDGQVYVRVDELAGSLRGRADAFTDAAEAASVADDDIGVLVSEVVAAELTARADALDVAGIELATTQDGTGDTAPVPPRDGA